MTLRADPSAYYILIVLQFFFFVWRLLAFSVVPRGAIPNKTVEMVASDLNHKLCR